MSFLLNYILLHYLSRAAEQLFNLTHLFIY